MAAEIYRIEIPIVVNDEYSEAIRKAEREVKKVLKKLDGNKARIDVDTKSVDSAKKKISHLERTARRKGELQISLRDRASRGLQAVQQGWDRLGRSRAATLAVNAHDRASNVLRSVSRVATSLPTMLSIGIGVFGASKAMGTLKEFASSGMELARNRELQEVSLVHWGKKGLSDPTDNTQISKMRDEALQYARDYALQTVYSPADVRQAMSKALQISGGNMAEAKSLVALMGDMAASYDSDIVRAADAYFNAQNGLYEMMDSYSPTKINKSWVDQNGGMAGLKDFMRGEVGGMTDDLAKTGYGAYSVYQGAKEIFKTEIGQAFHDGAIPFYEAFAQKMTESEKVFLPLAERFGGFLSNAMTGATEGLSPMFDKGLQYVTEIMDIMDKDGNALDNLKEVKAKIFEDIGTLWDSKISPKGAELGTAIGEGLVSAAIAGIPMIATALYEATKNSVVNAFKNPSLSSAGGAALALGGAGMLGVGVGKKVVGAGRGLMGAGRWIGDKAGVLRGVGGRQTKYRPDVVRRTNTVNEMERARKYSQTPQAYRPPKEAKSMYNTGFAKGGPMAGNLFAGAGRALKGVGGKLPGLNLLFGAYDGMRGWKDAGNIMGKTNDQLTMLDKAGSGAAKVLEGLTFGFLKAEKVVDTFTGGASAERRTQLEQQQLGYADTKIAERDASIGQHSYISDETREKNWQLLEGAPAVKETSEMLVRTMSEVAIGLHESFEPMLQSGNALGATFDMVNDVFEESIYGVGETFNSINEKGPIIGEMFDNFKLIMDDITRSLVDTHVTLQDIPNKVGIPFENIGLLTTEITGTLALTNAALMNANDSMAVPLENMGMLSTEATGHLAQLNASLSTDVPLFAANMTLFNSGLELANERISSGFEPIPSLTTELHGGLSGLTEQTHVAANRLTAFDTIGTAVNDVNSALATLATKIRNVQVQQSITFNSPTSPTTVGGPVRAYAKGGIATSPHIGLVAEAGVPEAMIPFDGSQRSKDLWTTTGHALGMFDTSTAFDTGISTSTSKAGGNAISVTVPINVVQDADSDAIIQATLNKVAKELRQVLETTAW